ncbi:RmlC-like cupin domain-containing protein [Mycena olivaceomarginata]|nr:RmlC-like cupin domain-containing protein [Mycena olivaceomarginata]
MFFTPTVLLATAAFALTARAAPTVASPAPVPIVTNAASIASGLKMQASSNDRLKKLLTDSSGNLLTGDAPPPNSQPPPPAPAAVPSSSRPSTTSPSSRNSASPAPSSFVEPCGLNIPHLHPRASELFTVIDGILDTGFVQENGFNTEVETQLGKYQATVFPMGSIHYQQNPTCSPAVFVAALNSEDPGRSDIATSYWMLPSDVVDAALGFPETIGAGNIADWKSHLPVNLAAGVESCLQACGLSQ